MERLKRTGRRRMSGSGKEVEENIIWIFGTIRTGSTWLGSMMADMKGNTLWNEPRVGEMFGHFFYERAFHRRENENFILSNRYEKSWMGSIRSFILEAVQARYPGVSDGGYLLIKEPSGSIGAPLLAGALPESRLILLIRDPRDAVASALDAAREGGWTRELKGRQKREEEMARREREGLIDQSPHKREVPVKKQVRRRAATYLRSVGNSRQAYERHKGPRVLVRYEDLVADTLSEMKRIYSELELPVNEKELARAVEKHSWENIPEEKKGEGKFYRKGRAGSWREDLEPEHARIVEEVTAPLLKEFYPK
jgi:hypothetical protein